MTGGHAVAADLFVVCQGSNEVDVLDTETGKVTDRIGVSKAPADIALSPEGRTGYVTHPDMGLLTRIDTVTRRVTDTKRLDGQPFGVVADPASGAVYVSDWSADKIIRLDPETLAITGTVAVGRAPAGLSIDPRLRLLYSADRESDTISIVDLASFKRTAAIAVGAAPFALDAFADPSQLAVAEVRSGNVSLVDKKDHSVTLIRGTRMPYGVAFVPGRRMLLVTDQQGGTLHVLDTDKGQATGKVRIGTSPEGVIVDASGHRAYVADWFSNSVAIVDLGGMTVSARIDVCAAPRMMAFGE